MAPPEDVLDRLNHQVASLIEPGRFVTTAYAILDPPGHTLEYALAGHPPPFVDRAATGAIEAFANRESPPLGVVGGARSMRERVTLAPGDSVVFYTDGLVEARGAADEPFGDERLRAIAAAARHAAPSAMVQWILDALTAHAAGAPLEDDVTVVVLRDDGARRAASPRSRPSPARTILPAWTP